MVLASRNHVLSLSQRLQYCTTQNLKPQTRNLKPET
jgi:hypothetical protein